MDIHALINHIEQTALPELAASWDQSGIQLAGEKDDIQRLAVALDPDPETIKSALDWGAECILTHHPLSLKPKLPQKRDNFFKIVSSLIKNKAWLYAAHTSLDCQPNGPVSWLAKDLGLLNTEIIEPSYTRQADLAPAWLEEQQLSIPNLTYGLGCIGNLPQTISWADFVSKLTSILGQSQFKCAGNIPRQVSKLAYCPGSGAFLINKAFAMGAQIYITGDLKYHEAQGITLGLVVDSGHFLLEEIMMQRFALQLKEELADQNIKIQFFRGSDNLQILDLANK